MPDTDDDGGFMLMTNVTRSHRIEDCQGVTFSYQRGDGGRRKHTRYFCRRSSRPSVGNLGQMLRPFFIATAFSSDLAGQSPGKSGRRGNGDKSRETITFFCFFHLPSLRAK